jgi:lipase ATG15
MQMKAYFIFSTIFSRVTSLDFENILLYSNILEFGKMSYNVYYDIGSDNWLNVTLLNVTDISITNDTVRAYLFSNDLGTENVVAFKGTSTYWTTLSLDNSNNLDNLLQNTNTNNQIEINSLTAENDKFNDNLYYSCCYYKQSNIFTCNNECNNLGDLNPFNRGKICCENCYKDSVHLDNNYIHYIYKIMENVDKIIEKDSKIVFTGHSLGGTLATLAGIIYNKPVVSFQSPGDLHYFTRIGFINDFNRLNFSNIYQFGHNGDPLFMGDCGSTCSLLGYNINTKCHVGKTCLYDSRKKLSISESLLNHRIEYVINTIIPKWENDFPNCTFESSCIDCESWNYIKNELLTVTLN